ncbi:MAG: cytochrome [Spirulinaceae cyanobacterium]
MPRTIIGIMGPGQRATNTDRQNAYQLGEAIARLGWVLLTGGRPAGVMTAAIRGAKAAGGLTVGILPGPDRQGADPGVDIAICTDLGNGRNNVNVLSADMVIACGMGLGTASEVALALKNGKRVILLGDRAAQDFFMRFAPEQVIAVQTVAEAIAYLQNSLPFLSP